MILICPPGSRDMPPAYGGTSYLPYRADPSNRTQPDGGPWLVDIPDDIAAAHFLGVYGFSLYQPPGGGA